MLGRRSNFITGLIQDAHHLENSSVLEVLDQMKDGMFIVDQDWRFLYLNQVAEQLSGKSRASLKGSKLWEEFPEMVGSYIHSQYIEAMNSGEFRRFEAYLSEANAWFETNLYPCSYGMAIFFRDITQIVKNRNKVEMSIREFRKSNRELENFAALVSHELVEPLKVISRLIGRVAGRIENQADSQTLEFVEKALLGNERVGELVTNVIAYARSLTVPLNFKLVDIDKCIFDAKFNLAEELENAEAEVVSSKMPRIKADQSQMSQLFQYVIRSALLRRSADAPLIQIRARQHPRGAIFSVNDNSVPYPKEKIECIFNVLESGSTTQRVGQNDGIELAISKRIVERHGGSVWIRNRGEEGSSLYFFIPRHPNYNS